MLKKTEEKEYAAMFYYFVDSMKSRYLVSKLIHVIVTYVIIPEYLTFFV